MNGIGSSSDQQEEVPAEGGRGLRIRRIILVATAVACTAGALAASISQPKPATARPPAENAAARASSPPDLAIAPVEPSAQQRQTDEAKKRNATPRTQAVSASLPLPANNSGIPAQVLDAYRRAANEQAGRTPGCHLPWTILAAIGSVESNHARGGLLTADGTTTSPILGPVLNGGQFAALSDTDAGVLDGDPVWDRAVGPMQFIPSTWSRWATSTRPLATPDPNNIFDAATTAAAYLCANNRDLNDPNQLNQAILSYNRSEDYLRAVLAWNTRYASGVSGLPAPTVDSGTQVGGVGGDSLTQPASASNTIQVSLPTKNGPVRLSPPTRNTDTAQGETVSQLSQPPTAEESKNCPEQVSARVEGVQGTSGPATTEHSTAACLPGDAQASGTDVSVPSKVTSSGTSVPGDMHGSGATEASWVPSPGTSAADEAQDSDSDTGADTDGGATATTSVRDEAQSSSTQPGTDLASEAPSADTAAVTCAARETLTLRTGATGGSQAADVSATDEVRGADANAGVSAASKSPSEETSTGTCGSVATHRSDESVAGLALGTTGITGLVSRLVGLR
jgi:membrane-bound lytic murein transglycosylase B